MNAAYQTWQPRVAYFISPHGFGHAARAAAVLEAFFAKVPQAHVTLFTTVPAFLFDGLPQQRWERVALACDVGLTQTSPLEIDLTASAETLAAFWPPSREQVHDLAAQLHQARCDWVMCDIAPLGILAAKAAGLPVVLLENFTWDWIYRGIPGGQQTLGPYIDAFGQLFNEVTYHLQATPVCHRQAHSLKVDLISRPLRQDRADLRESLGLTAQQRLVLVTMGGLGKSFSFLETLQSAPELTFLIPGSNLRQGNVVGLGEAESFYHPDWVYVADVVVGKLGYSTVAEVVQAGTPMAFVDRPEFPESAVLARFLRLAVPTCEIENFAELGWLQAVRAFAETPRAPAQTCCGAEQTAEFLCKTFWPSTNPQS